MERLRPSGQANAPLTSPSHLPASSNHVPLSPTSPFTPQSPKVDTSQLLGRESPPHPSITYYFDDIEVDQPEDKDAQDRLMEGTSSLEVDVSEDQLYPKPAAVSKRIAHTVYSVDDALVYMQVVHQSPSVLISIS